MNKASWSASTGAILAEGAHGRSCVCYTHSNVLQAGLGVAVRKALEAGLNEGALWQRCTALAGRARAGLRATAGVQVHDHGARLCAIVSFSVVRANSVGGVAMQAALPCRS